MLRRSPPSVADLISAWPTGGVHLPSIRPSLLRGWMLLDPDGELYKIPSGALRGAAALFLNTSKTPHNTTNL